MSDGPLKGLRVFDLTRVLAGPFCTALLADLGAEVIKLEPPAGDEYRHIGFKKNGESAIFQLVNRGKKSIVVDLKTAAGQSLAKEIALSCDVVVENFRPGVAAKLGLGHEALRALKSSLVYASISGFGQNGPWSAKPAYDLVAQALSGLMAVNGEEGGSPLKVGESIGDLSAGLFASWGILAGLLKSKISGEGSMIDVGMHDSLFALLPTAHAQFLYAGVEPKRVGNRHPMSTPFGCFKAQDGMFALAVLNDKHFQSLATLMRQPELGQDPRFANDAIRTTNEPALRHCIESWSEKQKVAEVIDQLEMSGIPAAPIAGFKDAAESEQAVARSFVSTLPHQTLGKVSVVGQPVYFGSTKPIAKSAAPVLGQHTAQILEALGYDAQKISDLRTAHVISGGEDDI